MQEAESTSDVLEIVQSTMAEPDAVTFEEGEVTTEIETIEVSQTGEPPKFDISSWTAKAGIKIDAATNVNQQIVFEKLSKQFSIPTKKSTQKDGKVQLGLSNKRRDMSFEEIASRYLDELQSTDGRRELVEKELWDDP